MADHVKAVVEAKEKELAKLVSAISAVLTHQEVTGDQLTRENRSKGWEYPEEALYYRVSASELRLNVDYLMAFLKEFRKQFGK